MQRNLKVGMVTLAVVLLLGVLGAGAAFAQAPTPSPSTGTTTSTKTDWQSVLLGKVANILGVDQQRLADAVKQANKEVQNEQIDQAVKDGRITQAYADWLKQRPDDGSLGFGLGGPGRGGFGHGFGGGHIGGLPGGTGQGQATPAPTP